MFVVKHYNISFCRTLLFMQGGVKVYLLWSVCLQISVLSLVVIIWMVKKNGSLSWDHFR